MKTYFYDLGYLCKCLNKAQDIQEPETNNNNAMHIWVQDEQQGQSENGISEREAIP